MTDSLGTSGFPKPTKYALSAEAIFSLQLVVQFVLALLGN